MKEALKERTGFDAPGGNTRVSGLSLRSLVRVLLPECGCTHTYTHTQRERERERQREREREVRLLT